MKLLVTGSTGFLGSYLVKALLGKGYEITILKRSFSNTYRIDDILSQIKSYNIDQCDLSLPFKDNGKYDIVIHTATSYGRNKDSILEIFKSNIQFPLQLLEVAASFGTKAFLNTDTFFNTKTVLCKYLNNYSLSKRQFVEWGEQFALMSKIKFVNIKLEHLYGPGDDNEKFVSYILKSCLRNIPELKLTLGEQKRDFIFVSDVVSAYEILLKKLSGEYFQAYNVGTGHSVSIKSFVETVHAMTNSKTHLNFGALEYRGNEIMESCANIEKLTQLGWKPKYSVVDGINKMINEESVSSFN